MEFTPIDSLVGRIPTTLETETAPGELGKDEFLKLLVTQLEYQDPMNPMEGTEFASQLAQFTSVEQISNLNDLTESGIEANLLLANSVNNTMSSTLIGKDVKAITDYVYHEAGNDQKITFDLPSSASEVTVTITDATGATVKTITEEDLAEGENTITWDGTNTSGYSVGTGAYSISVTATGTTAGDIGLTPYTVGRVEAVRFESSGAILVVDGQSIDFGSVVEIRNPDGSSTNVSSDGISDYINAFTGLPG